jgi:hypothetical protein
MKKQAIINTPLGILGGLLSGRRGDRLRAAGRGAVKGLGTDAGMVTGAAAGGALGLLTGAPILGVVGGGIGGGMIGNSLASSAIGPYETDEEKLERLLALREAIKEKEKTAMNLKQFGAKIAGYVDLHNAPKPAKKQLPDHEVFNNALMRAHAAGETPTPELFGRIQKEHDHAQKKEKKAQSSCTPCDMPNGPTNKKHTTGASPAVLEADEHSEEIGEPETTETEHDKSIVSGKLARAFGRKIAAMTGDEMVAEYGHPRAPVYGDPPPAAPQGSPEYLPQNSGEQLANKVQRWPHLAGKLLADAAKTDAAGRATKWPQRTWLDYITTGEAANDVIARPLAGTRDALASGIAYATTPGSKAKAVNTPEARAAIGGTQEASDAVNATLGPIAGGGSSGGGAPAAAAGKGGINPLLLAGGLGLGGAGLYGLYHYLNSKPKKKRDEELAIA